MIFRNCLALAMLLAVGLTGCMSTGTDTAADESQIGEESLVGDPFERHEKRIKSMVENIRFDRGAQLLMNLQWLIKQKELAIPHIVEELPKTSAVARANLLYVLGYTRSKQGHKALTAYLQDGDDVVRYEAAAGLLSQGDLGAVPFLVSFLESDQKVMRYKAIEALRQGTGRQFGYQFSAPAEVRHAAIGRWKTWWNTEKRRLMLPTVTDEK